MTGGELIGPTIIVAGENFTGDALGNSRLDLSGSAKLTVSGAAPILSPTANHRT